MCQDKDCVDMTHDHTELIKNENKPMNPFRLSYRAYFLIFAGVAGCGVLGFIIILFARHYQMCCFRSKYKNRLPIYRNTSERRKYVPEVKEMKPTHRLK